MGAGDHQRTGQHLNHGFGADEDGRVAAAVDVLLDSHRRHVEDVTEARARVLRQVQRGQGRRQRRVDFLGLPMQDRRAVQVGVEDVRQAGLDVQTAGRRVRRCSVELDGTVVRPVDVPRARLQEEVVHAPRMARAETRRTVNVLAQVLPCINVVAVVEKQEEKEEGREEGRHGFCD